MELLTDSPDVLSWMLVGLVACAAVASVCVVVCAVAVVVNRLRNVEHDAHGAAAVAPVAAAAPGRLTQLPVGAEAALNAIVELRPDPRNVVVTHRDPTGEVRLWPAGDVDHFQRSA
jgi:hypothetical protein